MALRPTATMPPFPPIVSDEVRSDRHAQNNGRRARPVAVGKPPDRAFPDGPAGFVAGEQERGHRTERGLVSDDHDGLARIGPVRGCQHSRHRRPRCQLVHRPEFAPEPQRSLLRAVRRRRENSRRAGELMVEPAPHSFRLFQAFGREPPPEVRLAGLGLRMPPKNKVHSRITFETSVTVRTRPEAAPPGGKRQGDVIMTNEHDRRVTGQIRRRLDRECRACPLPIPARGQISGEA